MTTTPGGGSAIGIAGQSGPGAAPAFQSAQKACNGILAAASSGSRAGEPSRQVFLAFARCLRRHGISDFPDPNPQGRITGQMIHTAGVQLKTPAFLTAGKACVGVTHGVFTVAGVERLANGPH